MTVELLTLSGGDGGDPELLLLSLEAKWSWMEERVMDTGMVTIILSVSVSAD